MTVGLAVLVAIPPVGARAAPLRPPMPGPTGLASFGPIGAGAGGRSCDQTHPAMMFPLRPLELSNNLRCSQSVLGPLPPEGELGRALSTTGGASPPGFVIYDSAMTYDAADGYVLLLGATGSGPENGTETWTYHAGVWTELFPSSFPESCVASSMAFDPFDSEVVYFAGTGSAPGGTCAAAGQTWTFRAGVWSQLHPPVSPPSREAAAFTNDSADGYMLLFGGGNGGCGTVCGDTWTFVGGAWTELFPPTSPSARAGAGLTYDAADHEVVLFGGTTVVNPEPGGFWVNMLQDTWAWRGGSWVLLHPSGPVPPEPYDDGFTYDAADAVPFFTNADDNATNCLRGGCDPEIWWTFHSGNWTNPQNNDRIWCQRGSPCAWEYPLNRMAEATTFDWSDGYVVLFGGANYLWSQLNDTWTYRAGIWSNVSAGMVASAVASPPSGAVPLTVSFSGTVRGGSAPYTWRWVYGDGSAESLAQDPVHTYNASGTYLAGLQVTDALGRLGSTEVWVYVRNSNSTLQASASATPLSGAVPLTVTFSGGASGGSTPYSWGWNFGDGGTSAVQNPAHAYTTPGTFPATLEVTDSRGATSNASLTITALSPPMLAVTPSATPSSGAVPLKVLFNATAFGGAPPYTWNWSYGDLTPHSYAENPRHTYNASGTYNSTVVVEDRLGHFASSWVWVTVSNSNASLLAHPSATPMSGAAPLAVSFTGGATGGSGTYVAYAWSFGDGSTSVVQDPTHTFTAVRSFLVTLNVTDSRGAWSIAGLTITVTGGGAKLTANPSANPSSGVAPLSVAFQSNPTGGSGGYAAVWYFGDGGSQNGLNVTHLYSLAGAFAAAVFLTDSTGGTSNASITVQVRGGCTGCPMSTTVASSPNPAPAGHPVTFWANASGGTSPYVASWSFGDGTNGTGMVASHSYASTGSYTATVEVFDSAGHEVVAQLSESVQVGCNCTIPALVLDLSATPRWGPAPLSTMVYYDVSGGVGTRHLNLSFGDGSTGFSQAFPSPSCQGCPSASVGHSYARPGVYTVYGEVSDGGGRNVASSLLITVNGTAQTRSTTLSPLEVGALGGGAALVGMALAVAFVRLQRRQRSRLEEQGRAIASAMERDARRPPPPPASVLP
ncbi:MAG: PKD domain-containing protein [Euryarchaeota archaeon]|nr:PKD domain-containing protein [Euryarchaeota archaeon]